MDIFKPLEVITGQSAKCLWSTCNPGITYPSTPFQTDTPLKHFLRKIHFAKRQTLTPFFSTFQPRETTGPGWYFFTNGAQFLQRQRTFSKVGRPLSPIGFRGSKLLSSVTSLWPDSMMSELVLCCQKLYTPNSLNMCILLNEDSKLFKKKTAFSGIVTWKYVHGFLFVHRARGLGDTEPEPPKSELPSCIFPDGPC